MNFNGKKVLILGMGREGNTTLPYLLAKYPDAKITVADNGRPEGTALKDAGVISLFGKDYPTSLEEWDIVIVSPGIPPHDALLQTAKPGQITTATNVFLDECKGRIVAVTGSKGKSTTASLIYAMLQAAEKKSCLVGNIGKAALGELLKHNEEGAIYVFEMSSAQAMRLTQGPDVAVILNLFPEHMDYHGDEEAYYAAKINLAKVQTEDQVLIHGPGVDARLGDARGKRMTWEDVELVGTSFALKGAHNLENMKAATKVARELDVSDEAIMEALASFSPLPHRLEFVGEVQGIKFYNDSISTTPQSTIAALEAISPVGTLILGGLDRGYDFSELGKVVVTKKVANVVLFPDSGANIKKALEGAGYEGKYFEVAETQDGAKAMLMEVGKWVYENTPENTICLLSPASPSYNLFKDFEERGKAFQDAVKTFSQFF